MFLDPHIRVISEVMMMRRIKLHFTRLYIDNITVFYFVCCFIKINAALLSRRDLF